MLITIGHTYGSGGLEIGRRLAARLEIPCGDAEADEGAVRSLAGRGSCVVVGLCADHVLSGQPGLNRIFIHCGMEQRVERLMRERGLSPAEAAREALRQDRERARLYGLHTGAKWGEVGRVLSDGGQRSPGGIRYRGAVESVHRPENHAPAKQGGRTCWNN